MTPQHQRAALGLGKGWRRRSDTPRGPLSGSYPGRILCFPPQAGSHLTHASIWVSVTPPSPHPLSSFLATEGCCPVLSEERAQERENESTNSGPGSDSENRLSGMPGHHGSPACAGSLSKDLQPTQSMLYPEPTKAFWLLTFLQKGRTQPTAYAPFDSSAGRAEDCRC